VLQTLGVTLLTSSIDTGRSPGIILLRLSPGSSRTPINHPEASCDFQFTDVGDVLDHLQHTLVLARDAPQGEVTDVNEPAPGLQPELRDISLPGPEVIEDPLDDVNALLGWQF
jgi:hypothetical protein